MCSCPCPGGRLWPGSCGGGTPGGRGWGAQRAGRGRRRAGNAGGQVGGLPPLLVGAGRAISRFAVQAEGGQDLPGQQFDHLFDVDADVVGQRTAVDGRVSEITREDDGTRQVYDAAQVAARRERVPFRVPQEEAFVALGCRQLVDGLRQDVCEVKWAHRACLNLDKQRQKYEVFGK